MNNQKNIVSIVGGLALIGLGILFFLGKIFGINIGEDLWPFWVIGAGAVLFVLMLIGGPAAGRLAVPGSIVVMVGLILLVLNAIDHMEGWAYAWTLIPMSVGIGSLIRGYWSNLEQPKQEGMRLIRVGAIAFVVFGAFFEIFIFEEKSQAIQILGPVLIILLGIYLLFRIFTRQGRETIGRAAPATPVSPTPVEEEKKAAEEEPKNKE